MTWLRVVAVSEFSGGTAGAWQTVCRPMTCRVGTRTGLLLSAVVQSDGGKHDICIRGEYRPASASAGGAADFGGVPGVVARRRREPDRHAPRKRYRDTLSGRRIGRARRPEA